MTGRRGLLLTYPRAWRELNGDVVLAMQAEADRVRGRRGPSTPDRIAFAVRGLLQHVRRDHAVTPSLANLVDRPLLFDQTNGVVDAGTDALDGHGMRIDRSRGRGGLDARGAAPAGLMEPMGH